MSLSKISTTQASKVAVGDYIVAGEGTPDEEVGRVIDLVDGHHPVVAWRQGVRSGCPVEDIRRISRAEYEAADR